MRDNEIVKALECCSTYKGKCTDCPAFVKVDRSNCKKVLLGAVDLINRQKSENERLKYNLKAVLDERADHSEAIKEFAERLKEKSKQGKGYLGNVYHSVNVAEIDNLLKEMVGDNDE